MLNLDIFKPLIWSSLTKASMIGRNMVVHHVRALKSCTVYTSYSANDLVTENKKYINIQVLDTIIIIIMLKLQDHVIRGHCGGV